MPKLNARENTRNRAFAKKRERTRLLRATLLAPAKPTGKSSAKSTAKSSAKSSTRAKTPAAAAPAPAE
jgi:hypothetical protein